MPRGQSLWISALSWTRSSVFSRRNGPDTEPARHCLTLDRAICPQIWRMDRMLQGPLKAPAKFWTVCKMLLAIKFDDSGADLCRSSTRASHGPPSIFTFQSSLNTFPSCSDRPLDCIFRTVLTSTSNRSACKDADADNS